MSAPHPRSSPAPDDAPLAVGPLPEEEFWERYNQRLEFPLAAVSAVLFHVVVLVGLVYGLLSLMADTTTPNPKLELVTVTGTYDEGAGSPGSGGDPNPDPTREAAPLRTLQDVLPTPQAIADVEDLTRKIMLDDPAAEKLSISPLNVEGYKQLNDNLRKKLLSGGSQQGSGPGPGKGNEGPPGPGVGGQGADSTRARGLRWVLRFRVANGRDYLEQLRAMGAEILVPIPPGEDECLLFPDLKDLNSKRTASAADFRRLAGQIKFSDTRREAVQGVAGALGLDITPKTFWAFFPKELEDKLARLETGYRNRRADDIEETIFRVTVRGGSYEFVVDEQTAKR